VVVAQLSQAGVLAANYIFALSRWLWWWHSEGMLWLGFSRQCRLWQAEAPRWGNAPSGRGWAIAHACWGRPQASRSLPGQAIHELRSRKKYFYKL